MRARLVLKDVVLIDRELGGYPGYIASYGIKGDDGWIIIDPGPRRAVEEILSVCPNIMAIIVTHIHIDHAGGAATLQRLSPAAKIYVHPRGHKHLINPQRLWEASRKTLKDAAEYYMEPEPAPAEMVEAVEEGSLKISNISLEIVHTPGHAPHHMSIVWDDVMFPGDAAGMYLCGYQAPTTPPRYELKMAIESIEKMMSYEPKRLLLPHFGLIENAADFLSSYIQLLEGIAHIINELIKEGAGFEEIYRAVRESSPMDKYIECLEKRGPPYMQGSPYRSVFGIYDYLLRTRGSQ